MLKILILLALLPAAASAATYTLTGARVGKCVVADPETPCGLFRGSRIAGTITIDEAIVGPITNRTLSWETDGNGSPVDGLKVALSITNRFGESYALPFLHALAGAEFGITTNTKGKAKDWFLSIFDGPPDYLLSKGGLTLDAGGSEWTGRGGRLKLGKEPSPAPIPLPAPALLLLGGLGLLGAIRRYSHG